MEHLIVGVVHTAQFSEGYLGPESKDLFRRLIAPRLTSESVVFVEGTWTERPLRNGSKAERRRRFYLPGIGNGVAPAIVGADARARDLGDRTRTMTEDIERFFDWTREHVRVNGVPGSLSEIVEWAQNRRDAFSILDRPPRHMRDLALRLWKTNERTDQTFERRMRDKRIPGNHRVLLVGIAHAIEIQRSTGWRTRLLISNETIEEYGHAQLWHACLELIAFAPAIAYYR